MIKAIQIYRVFHKISTYSKPISEYINASSNSIFDDNSKPENALFSSNKKYHSKDENGSYLQFEFLKSPVYVEQIKLQIDKNQDPTNWKIEGTDINGDSVEIYKNEGIHFCENFVSWSGAIYGACYCDYYANRTFEVKKGIYKDIRITLIGTSSCGEHYLVLNQVELFGKIMSDKLMTCKKKDTRVSSYMFLISLLTSNSI